MVRQGQSDERASAAATACPGSQATRRGLARRLGAEAKLAPMENPGAKPPPPPRATYADLVAADELLIAELIAGKLYTSRRLPPLLSIACMVRIPA